MKRIIYLSLALFCFKTPNLIAQESGTTPKSDSVKSFKQSDKKHIKKQGGKLTVEEKETVKQLMEEKAATMSPEEKKALRDKMKKRVEEMTPEERQEMRVALKKKFDQLSPEEKKEMMEKMENIKDSTGSSTPRRKRRN